MAASQSIVGTSRSAPFHPSGYADAHSFCSATSPFAGVLRRHACIRQFTIAAASLWIAWSCTQLAMSMDWRPATSLIMEKMTITSDSP